MNETHKNSLLEEFKALDTHLQKAIIRKYTQKYGNAPEGDAWYEYLKDTLRVEAYWKAVGSAD